VGIGDTLERFALKPREFVEIHSAGGEHLDFHSLPSPGPEVVVALSLDEGLCTKDHRGRTA
jgi:hypothetical protein